MMVASSIAFVLDPDLDTQLPHAIMLAQPSTAFRLIVKTTSSAGRIFAGLE